MPKKISDKKSTKAAELLYELYRSDLAFVHNESFGEFATDAGHLAVHQLKLAGFSEGTVVDLGCGSGITAQILSDAGYDVVGMDVSKSMLELARTRAPQAEFRLESFVTAEIPSCVAVLAIGEVFNYLHDAANNRRARTAVWRRIFRALAPGGLFVFDVAGLKRAPRKSPQRNFYEGPDWTVLVNAEFNARRGILTRRITTFRQKKDLYSRDVELHAQQLIDATEVRKKLRTIGFTVRNLNFYGSHPLPRGSSGFIARKPALRVKQASGKARAHSRKRRRKTKGTARAA